MMTELSLHVLDIAENSVRANASLVEITVTVDTAADTLTICIKDNGDGMDKELLEKAADPFYTTRTTRKVGLGIPFFKYSAEVTGGHFYIYSQVGIGTEIGCTYILSHIDRIPLGDMVSTIHTLIIFHPDIDFLYLYQVDKEFFILDTREFREVLGEVPFEAPEVSSYIKEFLTENTKEVNQNNYY